MGKRLKEERKKYHFTQEKVAEMLDISVKHRLAQYHKINTKIQK